MLEWQRRGARPAAPAPCVMDERPSSRDVNRISAPQEGVIYLTARKIGVTFADRAHRSAAHNVFAHFPTDPAVKHHRRHVSTTAMMRNLHHVRAELAYCGGVIGRLVQPLWADIGSQQ